ncbi:MAG TPA: hypothetical protein ENJ41_02435, partial [Oceanospirillales bacterium]|nr:hypothetical protein [Oceanospirillales bacterium]
MKNNRISTIIKVIALLFISFNSGAINLALLGATVNPDPIDASAEFTVSVDYVNTTDGLTPEPAQNIEVLITNFGIDPGADFSLVPATETNGWLCIEDATPATVITCNKSFAVTPLPANDIPQNFSFKMNAGANPISLVDFNLSISETTPLIDDVPADNTTSIFTSVAIPLLEPDYTLTLASGQVNPIQIFPSTTGNIPISFRLRNIGSAAGLGGMVSILVDPSFNLINVNIPPGATSTSWSCSPMTGGFDCINGGSGLLPGEEVFVNADISLYPTSPVGLIPSVIQADVFVSAESDPNNNSATIDVNINAAQ